MVVPTATFQAARRTIQGYEAIHMIRKGQVRWVSGSDVRRQIREKNHLTSAQDLGPAVGDLADTQLGDT